MCDVARHHGACVKRGARAVLSGEKMASVTVWGSPRARTTTTTREPAYGPSRPRAQGSSGVSVGTAGDVGVLPSKNLNLRFFRAKGPSPN